MTTPARGAWVTLEGRNGVGKTHLASAVSALLGSGCQLLPELTDLPATSVPGQVVRALARHGDAFLRTGAPNTETQLLLALHTHRHETLPWVPPEQVVLEDRGPLSVAVYQAAVLHSADPDAALAAARRILAESQRWRPPPDVTVLLRDNPSLCADRYARRLGRALTVEEHAVMIQAGSLYDALSEDIPNLRVLDRRTTTEADLVTALTALCRQFTHDVTGSHL